MGDRNNRLPFGVVCLTTIPQETWIGQTVLHPAVQINGEPIWHSEDHPGSNDPLQGLEFNIGVVYRVFPDPDFPDVIRAQFMGMDGEILHYGAANLWVPVAPQGGAT